jgi:hypothetical protein
LALDESDQPVLIGYGFVLENNEDDTVSFSTNTRTGLLQHSQELVRAAENNQPAIAASIDTKTGQTPHLAPQETQPARTRRDSSSYAIPIENLAVLSETRALRLIISGEREVPFNEVLRGALSLTQGHDLAMELANERELRILRESNVMTDFFPLSPTRNASLMVDQTILALRQYLAGLEQDMPKDTPASHRQGMAATFWHGQAKIVEGNIGQLEKCLSSLQKEGYIVTLSQILTSGHVSPDPLRLPLRAILEQCCQVKPKAKYVTENSLLEFAYVVWLCLLWLHHNTSEGNHFQPAVGELSDGLKEWLAFVNKHYGEKLRYGAAGDRNPLQRDTAQQGPVDDSAERYLEIVQTFAADATQAQAQVFQNPGWTREFLEASIDVFRQESVAFESMNRLVYNGVEEIDEPFLFIEHSS